MAEKDKKKDVKKDKPKKHSSGEISFGMEVLLFVVGLFILWVLVGRPETQNADKPFIKQQSVIPQ